MKVINKSIELICWFDKKGTPHPLRLRLLNEDGFNTVIKIDKIIKRDMEKLAGNKMLVFTCQSVINNTLRCFELKYEIDTCRWFLFKI